MIESECKLNIEIMMESHVTPNYPGVSLSPVGRRQNCCPGCPPQNLHLNLALRDCCLKNLSSLTEKRKKELNNS